MKKRFPITVFSTIAAAFAGGFVSQCLIHPVPVNAQVYHLPPPSQIRAQSFVLVDPNGHVRGEFKLENGDPEIDLYDHYGHVARKMTIHRGYEPVAHAGEPST